MTDAELRDAALIEIKKTTRGLSGYSAPATSSWGKALNLLSQIATYTGTRDDSVLELRQTTVGYTYYTKKGSVPGPTTHWGKALAYLAEIGVDLKVTITTDKGTSNLYGTVLITATPTAVGQVTNIKIYVDGGTPKVTDSTSPYTYSWDTTAYPDGPHTLSATVLYDRNNQVSTQLPVTVKNAVTPPPPPLCQDPPANTALPTLVGTATEGQTLSVSSPGSWTNCTGNCSCTYTYQWLRCDGSGANCVAIPNQTTSYTLASVDVGSTIRCSVTAHNGVGPSMAANTAQSAVVQSFTPAVPAPTGVLPVITGTTVQGNTLASSTGGWTNSPTSYAYQWKRCTPGTGAIKIGEQNVLANNDTGNSNLLVAQSATLSQTATIASLSLYVAAPNGGKARLGIYNDAGGRPGALKAATAEFTAISGWNVQNVVTPVSLTAGTYWLAYHPNIDAFTVRYAANTTETTKSFPYAYGALPDPFPTAPNDAGNHFSLYATFSGSEVCSNIGSPSSNNQYTLVLADVNNTMKCAVTASNGSGASASAATSAATAVVTGSQQPPPPPPLNISPPQPGAVHYGGGAIPSSYAHPGAMLDLTATVGCTETASALAVSNAGGTLLIDINVIVTGFAGPYANLMNNSWTVGGTTYPAIGQWPGQTQPYNAYGYVRNVALLVSSGKLNALLEKVVADNPHMGGFFADDLGTTNSLYGYAGGGSPMAAYHDGYSIPNDTFYNAVIAVFQVFRTVCDNHGLIFIMNGLADGRGNGGYPTRGTHGISLVDGACAEHHTNDGTGFWPVYMNAIVNGGQAQWATASPYTNGHPCGFAIVNPGDASWRSNPNIAWIAEQTGDYSVAPAPWSQTVWHANGLPTRVTR